MSEETPKYGEPKTEYSFNELVDEIVLSELEPLVKNKLVFTVCLNVVMLEYLVEKKRGADIETMRKRAEKLLGEFNNHYLERQRMYDDMMSKHNPVKKILNLVN